MRFHGETRILPYTPEQVFDVVADVERYPEFLPWWREARITTSKESAYETDQVIAFGMIRLPFHSRTELDRPRRIAVTSHGQEVRRLAIIWRFEPSPEGGCRTRVALDLELRSKLVEEVLSVVFRKAMRRAVGTFERRARALYGAPAEGRRQRRGTTPRTRAGTRP